jgi:hypothetical protein
MSGGLHHLGPVHARVYKTITQPLGRVKNIIFVLVLRTDTGNAQESFQLGEEWFLMR